MSIYLRFRRGTKTSLPTLKAGEPAFCTDTKEFFIGDGTDNRLINTAISNFKDLSDVPSSYTDQGTKAVRVKQDTTGLEFIDFKLTSLVDAPNSYSGQSKKVVRVNQAATGIEFASPVFTDLTDVPSSYSGNAAKIVRVNSNANGLEFVSAGSTIATASTAPSSPATNDLWLDTGTYSNVGYLNNLVEQKIINADTSSITFSGLDSSLDGDYYLEISFINKNTSTFPLYVNGDTTNANYKTTVVYSAGSTPTGGVSTYPVFSDYSAISTQSVSIKISVVNGKYMARSKSIVGYTTPSSYIYDTSVYRNTALTNNKISSLTILDSASANGIGAGSVFTLYKAAGASSLVSYNPIDISGRRSDYPMRAGEVVYKTYTSATSVPLYVTTVEGGEYELIINGDRSLIGSNTNAITLNPNNTTYTNAIRFINVWSSYTTPVPNGSASMISSFNIAGKCVLTAKIVICTSVKSKTIVGYYYAADTTPVQIFVNISNIWEDTTTAWASLGTLNFPYAQSGTIIIRRIL